MAETRRDEEGAETGRQAPQQETNTVQHAPDGARGGSSAASSSAAPSPSLSPWQNPAMTSSVISNLELGQGHGAPVEDLGTSGEPEAGRSSSTEGIPRSSTVGREGFGAAPLAPRDVLAQRPFLSEAGPSSNDTAEDGQGARTAASDLANASTLSAATAGVGGGADDSALDALVEAHKRDETLPVSGSSTPHRGSSLTGRSPRPDRKDASFGLDPDADTDNSVTGRPFRPLGGLLSSPSSRGHHHNHHHHHHGHQDRSPYDRPEESAPSHTTIATGAPATMQTASDLPDPVPSVSATGMPRFLPRRTSDSPQRSPGSPNSANAPAPVEMQPPSADVDASKTPAYAPSGSLTLAAFSPGPMSWVRRLSLVGASLAINLGLPFLNGVMLGFGEIFARAVVAPWIGLAPAAVNVNAPGVAKDVTAASFSPSNVGPRYGGSARSAGSSAADAGSKGVDVESWQVDSKPSRRRTEL